MKIRDFLSVLQPQDITECGRSYYWWDGKAICPIATAADKHQYPGEKLPWDIGPVSQHFEIPEKVLDLFASEWDHTLNFEKALKYAESAE